MIVPREERREKGGLKDEGDVAGGRGATERGKEKVLFEVSVTCTGRKEDRGERQKERARDKGKKTRHKPGNQQHPAHGGDGAEEAEPE